MGIDRAIAAVRRRSGLTLRELATRAGTSHSAIAAYEAGRVSPSVDTLQRVISAAGYDLQVHLERRIREADGIARGDELVAVLELAEQFPARHAAQLDAPPFGRHATAGRATAA